MFQAVVDPVAGNLAPVGLGCLHSTPRHSSLCWWVLRQKAHVSALVALVVALVVAIFALRHAHRPAALFRLAGRLLRCIPIVFIIIMAVWFYEVTVVFRTL